MAPTDGFTFLSPVEALTAMCERLEPVSSEQVPVHAATGRVLAEPILADRDSPPCDVSQMDGYALRHSDLNADALEVEGEAAIGQPPVALPPGKAIRIFTGAPIPQGAEVVIPREQVEELPGEIRLTDDARRTLPGTFIRRRGENLKTGQEALPAGQRVTPSIAGALAAFGVWKPSVRRRVHASILVTGNELVAVYKKPAPWQIHDSNGTALCAMFSRCHWLDVAPHIHVPDTRDALCEQLNRALDRSDAVLLTGGVSMGQYDFVPDAVQSAGGEIVFHKLPIRPGKPVLGAIGPNGQAIFGLPGNPVSAMVTTRRLASVALRRLAGFAEPDPPTATVGLTNADDKRLDLCWFRPVRLVAPGQAELVTTRGSGDLVSAARSDGFIEVKTGATGAGPWPFYAWEF